MDHQVRLEVPLECDGERLDKALALMLGVSRSEARYLVDEGVDVDGVRSLPSTRVTKGSVVSAPTPRARLEIEPEDVPFGVLLETPDYLVVDKPPGVVVHPGSGRTSGTLVSGLIHRYPEIEGVGSEGRWGLIHRLDRDTSGALLVARTQDSFEQLSAELRRREVARSYRALVDGTFSIPTGTIEAPIGRDPTRPTRRAVVADGKPATTHYSVLNNYPRSSAALLAVRLETGRTHQIRVHMAAIDHPVIGDRTYSLRPTRASSPRVFLHAAALEFTDPATGERVRAESPLPSDLSAVLSGLGPAEVP